MISTISASDRPTRSHFGIDDYACGLCQTVTPCESMNPVRHQRKKNIRT